MQVSKKIDNVDDYVEALIGAGTKPLLAKKTATIKARKAVVGEKIVTKLKDGHVETTQIIDAPGKMVVTNPTGESYAMDKAIFDSKYAPKQGAKGVYLPIASPVEVVPIKENIEFATSWGKMSLKVGAFLVRGNGYGIAKEEFAKTYSFCDEKGRLLAINAAIMAGKSH